jgi:glycosyltransferase involved in cell wall biosynthesis
MRLMHLSADYPDPLVPGKTRAIHNLLSLVPEVEHRVWSLNRVGWRAGIHAMDFADTVGTNHRAVAYGAPPRGVLLATFLSRLAAWIAADLKRVRFRPDAIHAHKVSVEGLVGLALAERLGCPLILSAQGDSDTKILGLRPDLRARWQAVWQRAVVVLPFAPWTADRLSALLGPRPGPVTLLPCPAVQDETVLAPRPVGPLFRTGLHLASAMRKNMPAVFKALGVASATVPGITLEIAGGGSAAAFAALAALAERHAPGRVQFVGAVPNAEMGSFLNGACAMLLPSRRESFGMISTEALFAGTPCLISQGWGIDGYLPDGHVTVSVPAEDPTAITEAILRLVNEEQAFKTRLSAFAAEGGLDQFRRAAIGTTYRHVLEAL